MRRDNWRIISSFPVLGAFFFDPSKYQIALLCKPLGFSCSTGSKTTLKATATEKAPAWRSHGQESWAQRSQMTSPESLA